MYLLLNIIKKIHTLAHDSLHVIKVKLDPFYLPKSYFCGGIGSDKSSFLFYSVAHAYIEDPVGLCWSCFVFLVSFISHSWKFTLDLSKNNCVLQFVILSILTLFLLVIVYFIPKHFIQFYYLSDLIPLLLIALFMCFILFLIIIFLILSLPIVLHLFY